jgi:hypothetical protein
MNYIQKKHKKMKTSQTQKHLGQSVAMGVVLVVMSLGIFALMFMQSGVWQ